MKRNEARKQREKEGEFLKIAGLVLEKEEGGENGVSDNVDSME